MSITLGDLARLVGGELCGDAALAISGAATLRDARPGEITLAESAQMAEHLEASAATAVVVPPDYRPSHLPHIVVADVPRAFAAIVMHFRPPRRQARTGISPAALVHPSARLAEDVDVHPGATIGEDVQIGRGSTIHSGVHLLAGTQIGEGVTIFPNAVLYENTVVGPRVIIHAGAVLGAYGFGYHFSQGQHRLTAQLGWVEIEADVEIGAATTIDRGTYGATRIGQGTKIDNQVMIGHNCRIGRHNLLCSQVGIAGSTTTGDYVVMAGQTGVRDHVHIGERAVLGAKSGVANDIPANQSFLGIPAVPVRDFKLCQANFNKLPEMRKQLRALEKAVEKLDQRTASITLTDPAPRSQDAA